MKIVHYGISAVLVGLPLHLSALESQIDVSIGAEHTNNSNRSSEDEQSELESYADLGVFLQHDGEKIDADLDYSIRSTQYDKDTQDDETVIIGDLSIGYEQIKNQLTWTLQNSRRDILRDSQLVDVQSNREDRSITSFGPELTLRLSGVDRLYTRLNYVDVDYEESEQQNSERSVVDLGWIRSISRVDTLSLDFTYEDIEFEGEEDSEYYSAAIRYGTALSQLEYSIAVGYNELKRDMDDVDGNFFEVLANYDSGGANWSLRAMQELTDSSQRNNNDGPEGFREFNTDNAIVDVIERKVLEFGYGNDNVCDACSLNAVFLYEEENFEVLDDDSEQLGFRLAMNYQFSRLVSIRGYATYRDVTYKGDNLRDDFELFRYGLGLSQRITQALSLDYTVGYEERDSDQDDADYDELSGGLRVQYRF